MLNNFRRINIDGIYTQNDGAVIKAYNPKVTGLRAFIDYININNVIQDNIEYSAAFISTSSGKIEVEQ